MRFPNLRYGNPAELVYYALSFGDSKTRIHNLARYLRRDERTVRDWLTVRKKVPWWVPELLRLRDLEISAQLRSMGIDKLPVRLGIARRAGVIELATVTPAPKEKPQTIPGLRLDDFSPPKRANG